MAGSSITYYAQGEGDRSEGTRECLYHPESNTEEDVLALANVDMSESIHAPGLHAYA